MRTKYGEITIGKIIVALFIVCFWTLVCSSIASGVEGFSFDLDIKYYLIGFLIYLFFFITAFIITIYDIMTKFNLPNFGFDKDLDKEILKLKQKGHFIYRQGNNYNAVEDETRYLNRDEITTFDRFFFKYGAPFNDIWSIEYGVVQWFGILPLMGAIALAVWVVLPLAVLFFIYNFFF
tara:strand:- start:57 stop:590 length:534 start_codon:yes stop_codon:yes gene_type:complete